MKFDMRSDMNRQFSKALIVSSPTADAAKIAESGNFIDGDLQLADSQIIFHGRNNYIVTNGRVELTGSRLEFFSDNSLIFLDQARTKYILDAHLGFGCTVFFGQGAGFGGAVTVTCAEEANVIVGQECAFGAGVRLCAGDLLPVWDELTALRVNNSASIYLGNHVWIAEEAYITRGVSIGSGSIVAPRSVVFKSVGTNVNLAGNPAEIINKKVCWSRHNLFETPDFNQPESKRPRSLSQMSGYQGNSPGEEIAIFSSTENTLKVLYQLCESVLTAGFDPAPKAEFLRNVLVPYRDGASPAYLDDVLSGE